MNADGRGVRMVDQRAKGDGALWGPSSGLAPRADPTGASKALHRHSPALIRVPLLIGGIALVCGIDRFERFANPASSLAGQGLIGRAPRRARKALTPAESVH